MSNAMREWLASNDTDYTYRVGDICRWQDKWMVCAGQRFAGVPLWDCYDEDGSFINTIGSFDKEISAPYRHDYGHFPDTVLARSTALKLTENS